MIDTEDPEAFNRSGEDKMSAVTGQVIEGVEWRSTRGRAFDRTTNFERSMGRPHGSVSAPFASLARTIETEVLPRLVLIHRAALVAPTEAVGPALAPGDVAELAELVLGREATAAGALVESARARGVSAAAIYLELLAPTARRLGELWDEDRCDFTQVTIGTIRLQQILRAISPDFLAARPREARTARVLLTPAPGEQHTFGLVMLAEFFRRAGWKVAGGPCSAGTDPVEMVRHTTFDVIGFSVGSATRLDAVARQIRALRRVSRNRAIAVMVGGPVVAAHPEIVTQVGADATAADARQAVVQARALLALSR
jgi:methanogenic corrinoid protein MtbC1